MASSLEMIPPYNVDTTTSGRAITVGPIGAIVVGLSGTSNGIIWDATNGTRWVVSNDGAAATVVTGVGYRTTPGGQQLVAHGLTTSGHNLYASMDDGVTWGAKNRLTNTLGNPFSIGTANTLGVSPVLEPDGTNTAYFGFAWNQSSTTSKQYAVVTATNGTAPDYKATLTAVTASSTSDSSDIQGVAGTGLSVGKRGANAYWVSAAGAKGLINTLNGTAGAARGISADATHVVGFGTVTDGRTGSYPWLNKGLIPGVSGGTAVELPVLAGASGYATNGVAYCVSQTGDWIGGMNYPGVERAVLWDARDEGAISVIDLTQFFADAGQLGDFTRLSRAYGVYDAGGGTVWVTGEGVWSPDGGITTYTRGFVAMISACDAPSITPPVVPDHGLNNGSVNVAITGANFVVGGTTVVLKQGATEIPGMNVNVTSSSELTVDFDLSGAATGAYDVVVSTCATATAPEAFTVEAAPSCNTPPQDVDGDGDVDLTDFATFQLCFNGPNRPYPPPPVDQQKCACLDADPDDGDVDLADFAVFQSCFNGPNRGPSCL